MCGRFANFTPVAAYAAQFSADQAGIDLTPRYNVYPASAVLACRELPEEGRRLALLHWGLVPAWSKDPKSAYRMINARAETVAEKPAYRVAFRRRRCLIAADGFFEWRPGKPRKQPFYIRLKGGAPFGFAGLWERWEGDGRVIESCSIIVTAANALIAPIHDRMPVIVPSADYASWLNPANQDAASLLGMLKPYAPGEMEAYPVGLRVNNPKHDDPSLLDPLPAAGLR